MIDAIAYVAGPFRGSNHWEIEQHIRHAEGVALKVWAMGMPALCPHMNTCHFQGYLPDSDWLEGDLMMLKRCQAIIMTDNWKMSEGAIEEHERARELCIRVFYESRSGAIPGLREWIEAKREAESRAAPTAD